MIIEKVNTEYLQYRIPSMVITQNKTLIAAYECRKADWDWAEIDLKIIRSTDLGESFETVDVIIGDGATVGNPVLIANGEKTHLLFCKNYKQVFHCVSEDDGKIFSKPEEISKVFEKGGFFYNVVAIGPGHGIVHNGNLIVSVWFAYNRENPLAHHPSVFRTFYSADNGKTWNLGEQVDADLLVDPSEGALAITSDNKVLLSVRSESKDRLRAFAESSTGFDGWGNIHFNENIPDPICQGSMVTVKNRIFFSNCQSKVDRFDLTVKCTTDNFKTFENILIDNLGGYSDIAATDDELFILYERNVVKDGLYFTKIKI